MKTPKELTDLLRRLPSASDLLEKPQIKTLVDRVNQLEVTSGVRQFVDRMRQEVSRRSLDMPIPSIGELADRAARYILGRHTGELPQAINATGQLWPEGLTGPPLAHDALLALSSVMQHYHVASKDRSAEAAAKLASADSALLTHSPAAALLLTLAALAEGRPIVVARGELGTLDAGARLTDLAKWTGVELLEVGATDRVEREDYLNALQAGAGLVLRIELLPFAVRGQVERPPLTELATLVANPSYRASLVHDIGRGPLAPLPASIPLDVVTASESLAAGASIVIARGDGYLGGPACGITLGEKHRLERLAAHPLSSLFAASSDVARALDATLELVRDENRAALTIPTLALLSTPLENLRIRAERLAAQIAEQPGVASATAKEIPAGIDLGVTQPLASYGISLVCVSKDRERIARQLEESRPRLLGKWNGEELQLDLRTVQPDDDIALVASFDPPRAEVLED